jgi:hypothetical protein
MKKYNKYGAGQRNQSSNADTIKTIAEIRSMLKRTGDKDMITMAEKFSDSSIEGLRRNYNILFPLWIQTVMINNEDSPRMGELWFTTHLSTQQRLNGRPLTQARLILEWTVAQLIGGNVAKAANKLILN